MPGVADGVTKSWSRTGRADHGRVIRSGGSPKKPPPWTVPSHLFNPCPQKAADGDAPVTVANTAAGGRKPRTTGHTEARTSYSEQACARGWSLGE